MFHPGRFLFFLTLTNLSCFSVLHAQHTKGYELTGHIKGLREGDKIVMNMMVYNPGEAVEIPKDSAIVKNGEFVIKGIVPEGPRIYWLRFGTLEKIYRMYIDNDQQITIRGDDDITKIPHQLLDHLLICLGSPTNSAYHNIWAVDDMLSQAKAAIDRNLKRVMDSVGYDKNLISRLMKVRTDLLEGLNNQFLYNIEPDMLCAAPLFALYEFNSHDHVWANVYSQLNEHLKNSVLGLLLKERLPLLAGQVLPNFSLPGPDGKTVDLKDQLPRGKITLVRFWATKSVRRKEFDTELRALYKQYHDKGLNIIAVSTDSYAEQWKETLNKELYPWLNVLDKKGETIVDTAYHELGAVDHQNTTNVLLDSAGRIIAWDVIGLDLQYYIDLFTSDQKQSL